MHGEASLGFGEEIEGECGNPLAAFEAIDPHGMRLAKCREELIARTGHQAIMDLNDQSRGP